MAKLQKAFDLFDAYNKQDPNTLVWDGLAYPAEYFYALQLHRWVLKLEPQATEAVLLASRCQHIGRWTIARDTYPAGKTGYLNWRTDLAKFHAAVSTQIMTEAGYNADFIADVQKIILKQKIKLDADVQLMENALCLVFLEFQFDEFCAKHPEDKLITIVKKTWNKMSEPGREAALTLRFSPQSQALLGKALS